MSVVQTQWDVASSAFSISDRALALMRAATRDDVQAAAAYAIEALGSMIITSPSLIGKAVDALGGNKSFRIENLKLVIGLSSNGVASEIRKSTPALRCFLLISALKLHIKPGQISNILYEMLEQSVLLNTTPVSDSQLAQLIQVINGNCNVLLDTEKISLRYITPLLNALAESDKQHISGTAMSEIYESMPAKYSAKLLLAIFGAIQDDSINLVKVTGWRGALWYASLIMWLSPGSVQVSLENTVIFRPSNEKAEIHIVLQPPTASYSAEWSVEKWSEINTLSVLLKIPTYDQFHSPDTFSPPHGQRWHYAQSRVPRELAYSLWQSVGSVTQEDLRIVACVTSGIVMSMIDNTRFRATFKRTMAEGRNEGPLLRYILPQEFLLRPMNFIVSFGFPEIFAEIYRTQEARDIRDAISAIRTDIETRDLTATFSPYAKDGRAVELAIVDTIIEHFKSALNSDHDNQAPPKLKNYLNNVRTEGSRQYKNQCHRRAMRICTLALHLASTCFLDSILSGDQPPRFLQLDNHFLRFGSEVTIELVTEAIFSDNDWSYKLDDDQGRWILDCFLSSTRRDICEFLARSQAIFRLEDKSYLYPVTRSKNPFVIAVDGTIIYPLCLLSHTPIQNEVARLGVVNGTLQWNGTRFDNLNELGVDSAPNWDFERAVKWVNLEDTADLTSVSCYSE